MKKIKMKNKIDTDPPKITTHKKMPLIRVIRKKCIDCCCGQHSEVNKCHITDCPLWPYRMGKNPFHKRNTNKNDD